MDIIITHIQEILPYYLLFETIYYCSKNKFVDFNHAYFLFHSIINLINTILLLPFISQLTYDPLGNNIVKSDWLHLDIIYPMIIGLHTFHLVHHLNKIKYDEIIHHIITHIFWYFIHIAQNPVYLAGIIAMSGIPGGITYLMLFMQKSNIFKSNILKNKNLEKKISMYLNIWVRMPICIIFATIIYIIGLSNNLYYGSLFMAIFTLVNGVHFMHNIIDSYYRQNN